LQKLGYELERGKDGQPEIKGYTREYLEASSPRRQQVQDYKREQGIDDAAAGQIAAHRTRDRKELLSPEEVQRQHRELAGQYGHQADRVVAEMRERTQKLTQENSPARTPEQTARQAVTYARDHLFEKDAVQDRRAIYETALNRGMGEITYSHVRQEFDRRMQAGEFREAQVSVRGPQITTAQMVQMEREIVGQMQQGNRRGYQDPMLLQGRERFDTLERHPELNRSQEVAVREVFASREKIVGIDGIAGAGKTTTLAVIREGAEAEGYRVEGFAPTSRAAQKIGEAGVETSTLQMHLARRQGPDTGEKRLYVLDESSLASTRQMHEFVTRLHPNDRVLLVGDRRQHEAVEAGKPFAQLQEAGMKTISLDRSCARKSRSCGRWSSSSRVARWELRSRTWTARAGCMSFKAGRSGSTSSPRSMRSRRRTRWSSRPTTAPARRSIGASMRNCNGMELWAGKSIASKRWCRVRTSPERPVPGPSGTR